MIEAAALRDPGIRVADRLAGAGLSLGALDRPLPPGGGVAAAPQGPPTSLPQSPFDRRDIVDIRGNLRPLAAESRVSLGAADEEGGGSDSPAAEGGKRKAATRPEAVSRPLLAAYGILAPSRGLAALSQAASPLPAGDPGRRSRRLSEAFRTPKPEESLGKLVDLAA